MLYYPNILARYSQSDLTPYVWLGIEVVKRFNLALYRVYQACSRIGKEDSNTHEQDITATPNSGFNVKDLQFPLPRMWRSRSKGEWEATSTVGVFCRLLDDTMDEELISKAEKDLGADWEQNDALHGWRWAIFVWSCYFSRTWYCQKGHWLLHGLKNLQSVSIHEGHSTFTNLPSIG